MVSKQTLAFVFLTVPALTLFVVGCEQEQPTEPLIATGSSLAAAAAGTQVAAPTGATAASSGESQIEITWQDRSSNESRFEVHRSITTDGVFTLLGTTERNAVAYRDQGLEPGKQYCYRIRAVRVISANKNSYSAFSNTACATALLAPPSSASAVPASETQIDISWQDNSSYETGFEIHRSAYGKTGPFVWLVTTGANAVEHSDGTLLSARQYCYQIRAFRVTDNGIFYSAFSDTACATTPALPAPSNPPATLSDVGAKPKDSHVVSISWTDNATNEDGFRIYRSTDGGAVWNLAGTTSPGQWSFEDFGRESEQQVWYRVMAFNAAGEGESSNIAHTTPPAGPTNLNEELVDDQTVELSWTDNSAVEDGYQVWLRWEESYCCAGGGACTTGTVEWVWPVAELSPNSTTYRYSPGARCGYYPIEYFVMATKDGGGSDPSNSIPAR